MRAIFIERQASGTLLDILHTIESFQPAIWVLSILKINKTRVREAK